MVEREERVGLLYEGSEDVKTKLNWLECMCVSFDTFPLLSHT